MENLELLLAIIFGVALVAGLASLGFKLKSKPGLDKQSKCEGEVSCALRELDPKFYVIFNNLTVPSNGNTSLTEIDHVVVSQYGIFCIETKSQQGTIYGAIKSTHWKQQLNNKERKLSKI